ncbi:MAG: redoxin domain-containing protein [Bacteroidetes bacterium]|nr:redoxin domain-containing protein [Bacteroidota bacterium]MCL2302483.1 redoxin domain-containing protein [Lentimicrobiaceae bacterium]
MKNIRHFSRFLFLLSVVFLPLVSFAQTSIKGYEIRFKPLNVNDKYLYLTGIYGNQTWVVDSAKFEKKQYLFKNAKQILPAGFYTIQSQNGTVLVEFIIDQTRKFSIVETESGFIFINSDENVVFQQFKKDLLAENDLRFYHETAPESLLGKFVLAQYIPVSIPEFFWGSHEGREGAAQKYYQYIINHFYDNVDFRDIRLMRTPLNIDLRDFFVEALYPQTAENVIESIGNLFNRMLDEKPTPEQLDVRDFYLKKLIHLYMNLDPKFDPVFVYLVDNYVSKLTDSEFISDSEVSVFKRIADRKRRTLVGQTVPVFESYMKDRHVISTADMTSKYTVLWFWDPDCDHCLEYTPNFFDFYSKYHDVYNFEVIACSVTEDYDRWIAFINEHHLDWFNTSYAIAEPNYDAIEFFNFDDTPAIFIIDKQHKIVARQFPLDELFEIFESLQY